MKESNTLGRAFQGYIGASDPLGLRKGVEGFIPRDDDEEEEKKKTIAKRVFRLFRKKKKKEGDEVSETSVETDIEDQKEKELDRSPKHGKRRASYRPISVKESDADDEKLHTDSLSTSTRTTTLHKLVLERLQLSPFASQSLGSILALALGIGYAVSTEVRCICCLTVPSLCGKAGRMYLSTFIITFIILAIFTKGVKACYKSFGAAYDRCHTYLPIIGYLLCWPMKLTFICDLASSYMGKRSCNSDNAMSPGFGESMETADACDRGGSRIFLHGSETDGSSDKACDRGGSGIFLHGSETDGSSDTACDRGGSRIFLHGSETDGSSDKACDRGGSGIFLHGSETDGSLTQHVTEEDQGYFCTGLKQTVLLTKHVTEEDRGYFYTGLKQTVLLTKHVTEEDWGYFCTGLKQTVLLTQHVTEEDQYIFLHGSETDSSSDTACDRLGSRIFLHGSETDGSSDTACDRGGSRILKCHYSSLSATTYEIRASIYTHHLWHASTPLCSDIIPSLRDENAKSYLQLLLSKTREETNPFPLQRPTEEKKIVSKIHEAPHPKNGKTASNRTGNRGPFLLAAHVPKVLRMAGEDWIRKKKMPHLRRSGIQESVLHNLLRRLSFLLLSRMLG
ncbi:hypothetical protein HNY73_016198 [Argiope bruennichi]|uniref:Uncharacterized protein n=1 Tax=Argiope bruennichi TaxID=94029 RepID=A0A8T0EHQ5_ARGBR|nr:hypothetical protein HNY73_016198 [Argiope bruennichi]